MTKAMLKYTFVAAGFAIATAAGAGHVLAQTQTPTRPANDTLEDRILYRLETDADTRKYDIKVDVDAGVATISGDVASAAQKEEAARLAKVDGITRVENKITIDPDEDKTLADRTKSGLNKAGDKINEAWITTKVKWFFMGEDALKGSDINVDTKDNVVTLKGTVASEAGRARAKELATNTDGVKRVVDTLTIKVQ